VARKKNKIRVELRKDRDRTSRDQQKLSQLKERDDLDDMPLEQRMSGKGELTRRRTVITGDASDQGHIGGVQCLHGRVLTPRGGGCVVRGDDGLDYQCAVRRIVRSLSTNARTAVVAGDLVWFSVVSPGQGAVERVDARRGTLSRMVRGQKQVLVANVDCALIVTSAADPPLKPSLIDRYLISAALGDLRPIICINKADLIDPADMQPIVGLYSQLGYDVVLTSVEANRGIKRLQQLLTGRQTVLSGQSGVGKSSLINAVQPGLNLRTAIVSVETHKGRHTTTAASLLSLSFGGWVVDTPGIRQLELADIRPEEVQNFFREFRPFIEQCRYPGCSHMHEQGCAVRRAVAERHVSVLRYESYCRIRIGDPE